MNIFPESSFFQEKRAPALPTPADVRATIVESGNCRATRFNRPSPVMVLSLGLLVKYGADITLPEIHTQRMVYSQLHSQVLIPEVFGWTEDGGQQFIYISLIQGETLQVR